MTKRTEIIGATKQLWQAIEAAGELPAETCKGGPVFPDEFLIGMRAAVEAGVTCEQIVAHLTLITGLHKLLGAMDGEEMVLRSVEIVRVMRGDLEYLETLTRDKARLKALRPQIAARARERRKAGKQGGKCPLP